MSTPFDLDAVVVEADDLAPFAFTWGGKAFELPPFLALPVDRQIAVVDAITGDADAAVLLGVLRQIVGTDLLAELSATTGGPSDKPMSAMRLMRLIGAWMDHQTGPGKSRASSASSASTAKRSRPTSRSGRVRKTS